MTQEEIKRSNRRVKIALIGGFILGLAIAIFCYLKPIHESSLFDKNGNPKPGVGWWA